MCRGPCESTGTRWSRDPNVAAIGPLTHKSAARVQPAAPHAFISSEGGGPITHAAEQGGGVFPLLNPFSLRASRTVIWVARL